MSSIPARFASGNPEPGTPFQTVPDERRRQSRVARFDVHRQPLGRLAIVDVSPFGCCVRNADPEIGPGHFVSLQFTNLAAITGYVRWRDEDNIGLEFCRTIAPATERAIATNEPLEALRRL